MSTVLIFGAARGIGHVLAMRAIARNDIVFAVVRKESDRSRFQKLANLSVVLMDVSDTKSVEAGFKEVDRLLAGKPLDAIINSAAISRANAIEVATVADFEQTLNTNTLGSLRILKAAIPRLRGHGGRLILITSLWGKASGALLGSYCASKHAIESLADVARRETLGMNLHIILAEPGVVKTEMLTTQAAECDALIGGMSAEHQALYASLYRRYANLTASAAGTAISAEQCAACIERALFARRPHTRYRIGPDATIVCFLAWLLPDRWMDCLMGMTLNRKPLRS
ncbi:MAG TPA: SDR family NAD(P)-dependent oxidoreductase [Steroidobacteraceae bacterium]|jgi:NAD(P)-dependent dehydrogenase (short-subunit alcohol dehydrogenase family)